MRDEERKKAPILQNRQQKKKKELRINFIRQVIMETIFKIWRRPNLDQNHHWLENIFTESYVNGYSM